MSADLETALRDMLHERAADITTLPPRLTHPDQLADTDTTELLDEIDLGEPHRPGRHSRWLLAAAVAVIVVIAGAVVGIRQLADDNARPATPNSVTPTTTPTSAPTISRSPSPTPTTSTHLSEADGLHAASCTVSLPAAWQHAIDAGTVTMPGYTLQAMAMSASGTVVADASQGHQHKLVLVDPDGTIRTLYASDNPPSWGEVDFGWAAFAGNQVAFTVLIQSHKGGPGPTQIDLIDVNTGAITVVRPSGAADISIVSSPVLLAGKIYWNEWKVGTTKIREYDIASGKRSTLATGRVNDVNLLGPFTAGGGLYWAKAPYNGFTSQAKLVTHIPGMLPSGYETVAVEKGRLLAEDGGVYAWTSYKGPATQGGAVPPTVLWLWRPGMSSPLEVSKAPLITPALAMPYATWPAWGGGVALLDTRTGAVAKVGTTASHLSPHNEFTSGSIANSSHVALEIPRADGTFALSTFSITGLPGLHC